MEDRTSLGLRVLRFIVFGSRVHQVSLISDRSLSRPSTPALPLRLSFSLSLSLSLFHNLSLKPSLDLCLSSLSIFSLLSTLSRVSSLFDLSLSTPRSHSLVSPCVSRVRRGWTKKEEERRRKKEKEVNRNKKEAEEWCVRFMQEEQ
jgi:hypothetical protein